MAFHIFKNKDLTLCVYEKEVFQWQSTFQFCNKTAVKILEEIRNLKESGSGALVTFHR